MQDSRLPPDALFLVFEEDFRWWPDEKEPMREALQLPSSSAAEPTAAAEQNKKGGGLKPKSSAKRPDRARGQWWELKPQGRMLQDGLAAGVPQEVADCVRYSIKAKRAGVGELMWMGYHIKGKRKTHITSGTHFFMLTKSAGAVMLDAMRRDELERGPVDVTFKRWLLKHDHDFQRQIGFSYLYPPMGGFTANESDISVEGPQKKPKFQKNFWELPASCVGTRRSDDEKTGSSTCVS